MARQTSSVVASEGSCNKTLPENSQVVQRYEKIFSSSNSDLKTAVEMDESNEDKKLITSVDVNKSTPATNSINSYKRSVSPDTMLRGAT